MVTARRPGVKRRLGGLPHSFRFPSLNHAVACAGQSGAERLQGLHGTVSAFPDGVLQEARQALLPAYVALLGQLGEGERTATANVAAIARDPKLNAIWAYLLDKMARPWCGLTLRGPERRSVAGFERITTAVTELSRCMIDFRRT